MTKEEEILTLSNEGFSNKEIADKVSTEDDNVSYQAVAKVIKQSKPKAVKAEVITTGLKTFTAEEYAEYSVANGRSRYGGEIGVTVSATIEELRAYINSGWKPTMLLEKWQMSEDELRSLTILLARRESRDREPTVNYKQDFFRF